MFKSDRFKHCNVWKVLKPPPSRVPRIHWKTLFKLFQEFGKSFYNCIFFKTVRYTPKIATSTPSKSRLPCQPIPPIFGGWPFCPPFLGGEITPHFHPPFSILEVNILQPKILKNGGWMFSSGAFSTPCVASAHGIGDMSVIPITEA